MANFVEGMDVEAYFGDMEKDGVWGDDLVLLGLSHALKRTIRIVLSIPTENHHVVIETTGSSAAPILLGLVGEHHYMSLEQALGQDNGWWHTFLLGTFSCRIISLQCFVTPCPLQSFS